MESTVNKDKFHLNENHELNETDFTKKEDWRFSIEKRKSKAYCNTIEIGNMNVETPLSFFIKKFYKKTMNSYVVHRQIYLNNKINDVNYIFLMKEDILIVSDYDFDTKNSEKNDSSKVNPIIHLIDYRQVIIFYKI